MGHWTELTLSGSNTFVNDLYGVLSSNATIGHKVITYSPSSGIFRITGSYRDAGNDDVAWFPYDGNAYFTAVSSETREITIGKNRTTDGFARLELHTDNTTDQFRISATSGQTTFSHSGSGEFAIDLISPNSVQTTDFIRPATAFPSLANDNYDNLDRLVGTGNGIVSGTISQTFPPSFNNGYSFLWLNTDFGIELDDVLTKIEYKTAGNTLPDGGVVVYAGFIDGIVHAVTDFPSYLRNAVTSFNLGPTSYTQIISGSNGLFGALPLVGDDYIRFKDLAIQSNPSLSNYWALTHAHISFTDQTYYYTGSSSDNLPSIRLSYIDSSEVGTFRINQNSVARFTMQKDGRMFARYMSSEDSGVRKLVKLGVDQIAYYDPGVGVNSTKRIKKKIHSLDDTILKDFDRLNPVSFAYIENNSNHLGFIAEEVAEINPMFAKYGANYQVNDKGVLDDTLPLIDDSQVPLSINNRAIIAASVAKLQSLEQKLNSI